jgi:tetratricopeptide (TPR) repeat protein
VEVKFLLKMKGFVQLGVSLMLFFVPAQARALHAIDSLLMALPTVETGQKRIDLLNTLALAYTVISVEEAEKFATQAIGLAREVNYEIGLAESYKVLGMTYYVKGEHDKAIEYSFQSLKLYESADNLAGQSDVLNNMAVVFTARKELDKAYNLSIRSLRLKREIGDSVGVATSILALAEIFMQQKKADQALKFGLDALSRYRSLDSNWGISQAMLQLGKMYHQLKNFPYASGYYYETIRTAAKANDHIQTIAAYKQLGKIYLEADRYDSSYYYLRKALSLAREKNSKNNEMETDEYLSRYFSAIDHLDSSLYYTKAAGLLEREIFDSHKSQQIATMQMLYEFEKKEQILSYKEEQIQRQYLAIIGVTLILVLVTIFGYKLYWLNKNNKTAREALQTMNQEINKLNENLEVRVQERTEEIRQQNQMLVEYAFFTAHEVRGPLARILGLVDLVKVKELNHEREEIISRLQIAANELDEIIRTVSRKLEDKSNTKV